MKSFVATLWLLALSMQQAFGAAVSVDVDTSKSNVLTGGLEKLIKECTTDFTGCDESVLKIGFDVIKKVAATAGSTVHVAGSIAQKAVNEALETAFRSLAAAGDITSNAVNTAVDVANKAVNTAAEIANQAINTAGGIADQAINAAGGIADKAKDAARKIFDRFG